MSDNNGVNLFGIAVSIVGVYVAFNIQEAFQWANGLGFWEIPAKIVLIVLFIEGAILVVLLFLLILFCLFVGIMKILDRIRET